MPGFFDGLIGQLLNTNHQVGGTINANVDGTTTHDVNFGGNVNADVNVADPDPHVLKFGVEDGVLFLAFAILAVFVQDSNFETMLRIMFVLGMVAVAYAVAFTVKVARSIVGSIARGEQLEQLRAQVNQQLEQANARCDELQAQVNQQLAGFTFLDTPVSVDSGSLAPRTQDIVIPTELVPLEATWIRFVVYCCSQERPVGCRTHTIELKSFDGADLLDKQFVRGRYGVMVGTSDPCWHHLNSQSDCFDLRVVPIQSGGARTVRVTLAGGDAVNSAFSLEVLGYTT